MLKILIVCEFLSMLEILLIIWLDSCESHIKHLSTYDNIYLYRRIIIIIIVKKDRKIK
jgi:hypothetical protein